MLFQQLHIPRIAFVHAVREVSEDRHEPDPKVDQHVEFHAPLRAAGQGLDLATVPVHDPCEQEIDNVTDRRHDADDCAPAEADAAQVEEAEVEAVGLAFGGFEDLGFFFGEAFGKRFLDLFGGLDAEAGRLDAVVVYFFHVDVAAESLGGSVFAVLFGHHLADHGCHCCGLELIIVSKESERVWRSLQRL